MDARELIEYLRGSADSMPVRRACEQWLNYRGRYDNLPRYQCLNGRHFVLVQRYVLGQFRLQLCDKERPDSSGYDGASIVREMCTYDSRKAVEVLGELLGAADPEKAAQGFAKPWNCEHPGGRIRLDNREGDR